MRTLDEVVSEMQANNADPRTVQQEIDELEQELFLFLMKEAYGNES